MSLEQCSECDKYFDHKDEGEIIDDKVYCDNCIPCCEDEEGELVSPDGVHRLDPENWKGGY